MTPTVAIVGRPNVGKSTLFNRLLGERKSIVHDRPGVTRDRNYGLLVFNDQEISLIDTGGFEPDSEGLLGAMRTQVMAAIREADVLIFILDRKSGLTPPDELAASILRSSDKPVLMAVNKVDVPLHEDELGEFWKLGFDRMFPISAEHGRGIYDLMDAVLEFLPESEEETDQEEQPDEIKIAILGRPNIGKSTLANMLCGTDRHLVHDEPGTTMDSIDSSFEANGQRYRIVDTAGIRRKARIDDKVEEYAVSRAIKTIERCHLTLLMLDGTQSISTQDARLANLVEDRGRALIILINKWDLVKDIEEINSNKVEIELRKSMPHATWAPILYISALTGKGIHRIVPTIEEVYKSFDTHISTSRLNGFLRRVESSNPPPQSHNHPVRIHYVTQSRVRPPTFTFFSNSPEAIKQPYRKFLSNQLREVFGFVGSPIRVHVKKKRKIGEELEQ